MTPRFDPFTDRLARDIRNGLSTAFIALLAGHRDDALENVIDHWRRQSLSSTHRQYIADTLTRYNNARAGIAQSSHTDARHKAITLWNHALFFEVHEILESVWLTADPQERRALKGLIQAAGVHIHRIGGNRSAARSLAVRAKRHLDAGRGALGYIANIRQLERSLDRPLRPPPRLHLVTVDSAGDAIPF